MGDDFRLYIQYLVDVDIVYIICRLNIKNRSEKLIVLNDCTLVK
jgi:hypothetical protein